MAAMEIAITGASGLIGSALASSLTDQGHRVVRVVRRAPVSGSDEIRWDPAGGTIDAASLEGIDGVVHLAGAGIGDKRWTDDRKKLVLDSRVDGTTLLATTLAGLDRQPSVLVSSSAIGYYGAPGEFDESSPRGSGYLADVCVAWEAAAQPAIDAGIRTALPRTGVVLTPKGGSLKKQLPLFKLGLGGRFGSGEQWLSWISLVDEVRALEHLLASDISGPVNLCAPHPVTNNTFTKTLGAVLKRPTILPVPLFGPRLLFGKEFVDEVILGSQKIAPKVLTADGFEFETPELEPALRKMLGR